MIVLPSTTYILQLVLSAGTADATVSYVDRTATAYALGVTQETAATAATQTICSAPAASTERAIDFASVYYKTTGGVVTVQTLNSSGSVTTILFKATLVTGDTLQYTHGSGFRVLDTSGQVKEVMPGYLPLTGGTVSGAVTFSAALTYGGVTLTNAVTGTGKMVLDTGATIGAHTLSGTISGGGNQINNVILGSSNPLAASVTTFSASGAAIYNSTVTINADSDVSNPTFYLNDTSGSANARNWKITNGPPGYAYGTFGLHVGTTQGGTPSATASLTISSAGAVTIPGTLAVTGAFGCNTKAVQTAYASGGALAAYGAGANGLDSGANMSALHALVVAIRAALVANGIMS